MTASQRLIALARKQKAAQTVGEAAEYMALRRLIVREYFARSSK
jgi:hypothetical protein